MRKPPLQDVIVMKTTPRPQAEEASYGDVRSVPLRRSEERPVRAAPPQEMLRRERPQFEAPPRAKEQEREPEYEPRFSGGGRVDKKWTLVALGVGAVVVGTAFLLSVIFAGAEVTVYPKQDTVVVNATFAAQEQGAEGALPFKRMVIERTAVEKVPAQSEQQVEERAQGTITIYNAYIESPQRLIKNTRFEASDGKIYRIRESVEVPGKKADGTPGSVDVTIYAEEPGESYNRGPSEFTVPGFVGLPQEGKVYGRSSADISGGFVGVRRTVAEADRKKAMESIESKLRDELLAELGQSNDMPAGYRPFKDAVFFEFNALPDEVTEGDSVSVSLSGKLHAVLFEDQKLAMRLAQLTIGSYEGSPIRIENMAELPVRITPTRLEDQSGETVTPWNASAYSVVVSGKAVFIWEFDSEAFGRDLAGKDKAVLEAPATDGILGAYPGIDRAHATIRPFWKRTFPEDPEDVKVQVKLDE